MEFHLFPQESVWSDYSISLGTEASANCSLVLVRCLSNALLLAGLRLVLFRLLSGLSFPRSPPGLPLTDSYVSSVFYYGFSGGGDQPWDLALAVQHSQPLA